MTLCWLNEIYLHALFPQWLSIDCFKETKRLKITVNCWLKKILIDIKTCISVRKKLFSKGFPSIKNLGRERTLLQGVSLCKRSLSYRLLNGGKRTILNYDCDLIWYSQCLWFDTKSLWFDRKISLNILT